MLSWVKTQGPGGLGMPQPYSRSWQPAAVLAPNGFGGCSRRSPAFDRALRDEQRQLLKGAQMSPPVCQGTLGHRSPALPRSRIAPGRPCAFISPIWDHSCGPCAI